MKDGLYQVTTNFFCAAFVIRNGRLAECAPIIRKQFQRWSRIAIRIGD